jgi:hypothetical protein
MAKVKKETKKRVKNEDYNYESINFLLENTKNEEIFNKFKK